VICIAILIACSPYLESRTFTSPSDWKTVLQTHLPLYGHRNWIVVSDSAFPAYAEPGIETIVANDDLASVLQYVAASISASRHVRATVLLDKEIDFVEESDYPGVSELRRRITTTFAIDQVSSVPHSEIMKTISEAGATYRVLFIKTTGTVPYSSVYIRLDCGYMSDDVERRIRNAMAAADSQKSK
jgi:RbsD / FucU transport protein family